MAEPRWRWRSARASSLWLTIALLALGITAGCSEDADPTAIVVDQPVAMADAGLRILVTGVGPGEHIEVAAEADDHTKTAWRSRATFVADGRGKVDIGTVAPIEGTYSGVDGMGLFWSMNPVSGVDDTAYFVPDPPGSTREYEVRLTVRPEHSEAAQASVRRVWMTADVTHRRLELAVDTVVGHLYEPATESRGGVLVLGGSEGGISMSYEAALLASHGFTALALGYFAMPGLPQGLRDIPIEYFAAAARLLPGPIRVIGYSRGTEAAMLLSALYPDLVRGTILYAPADHVWGAFPPPGSAWTHGGLPQATIPFDRIAGPVLAIAGTDDQLWPSGIAAGVVARLTGGESILYAGAGHGVGTIPYLPAGTRIRHPLIGELFPMGGSREANEKAHRESWTRVLEFLR